jgi:DNA-binding transcriptional LysR family regulator
LNLIVALEVLLAERNVTRAAERLGTTQSTMSHSLARLRDLLGDALLVREGRAMVTTPRAEEIAPKLARALEAMRAAIAPEDPAAKRARTFVLAAPDLIGPAVPALVRTMNVESPDAKLRLRSGLSPALARELADGTVDVALLPVGFVDRPSFVQKKLGSLHHAVVARRGHPGIDKKGGLTREAWRDYPHVQVRTDAGPGHLETAANEAKADRKVGVVVESFLVALHVVAGSDCFFTTPRELVGEVARALGLVLVTPPISVPPMPVVATWHERFKDDDAHRWFREVLVHQFKRAMS